MVMEMHDIREKLRAQALQLAAQLPEDHDEALQVIGYLRELIEWGMGAELSTAPQNPQRGALVRFPGWEDNSPSRRANSSGKPSGLPK